DAITGPVVEFRADQEPGYPEAKPGANFLNIGVGVLRKVDDSPYKFGTVYPIVDPSKWHIQATNDSLTVTRTLPNDPTASAYTYTVQDTHTTVGDQPTSDSPISRFYLCSTRTTLCPEAYIHIDVAPGKTQHWNINYRFFAPSTTL